jgi:hypothetical protein
MALSDADWDCFLANRPDGLSHYRMKVAAGSQGVNITDWTSLV